MMLAKILLLVGVAAAAPCTVKCCMGKWDGNTCNVEVGWQDTNNPLTTLHDTTSGHEQHRCYFDENHVNMCACTCKNEGDEFESTEDGSQLDAATGATASEYKVTGTATLTGVTLDVAYTTKFKTDFKSGVATKLGVDSNTVGIISIYQATGRRLLSASSGIKIDYVIYATSPEAIQQIVQNPSKSFKVEGATATVETKEEFHVGTKGGRCASDQVIDSEETCKAALAYLGNAAQDIHWQGATTIIPKGCSLKHTVWHGNPHFNAYTDDEKTKLRDDMTPICAGAEKYHVGVEGGRCAVGQDILTKADCMEALDYISNPVLAIHWEGTHRGIPNGCSLKHTVWHGNPHYNKATNSVKGRSDMTPICKGPGSPATGRTNTPTKAPTPAPTKEPTPEPTPMPTKNPTNWGPTPLLTNGWQAYGQQYGSPTVSVTNGICVVEGLIKNGQWGSIANLPAGCRPTKRLIFDINNHASSARVDVQSNGVVSWHAGGDDHGWISLSGISFPTTAGTPVTPYLKNGWQNYGGSYGTATYKVVDGMCYVEGLLKHGTWGTVMQLPAACRPTSRHIFDMNNHGSSARVDVQSNGVVSWHAGGDDHKWISLSGISFPTTAGTSVALTNGWQNFGHGYSAASFTKANGQCSLSGLIKNGAWSTLLQLPAGCRPNKRLIFDVNNHGSSARVDVATDGTVSWHAGGKSHGWISLSGIRFDY